ncbi:MAG: hypothetical protein COB67_05015 [SAR324 cluster bacterium]|uniref:Uncharacterized protein n=1 Tax=SAR324 cluster bacterium TaxID=2024889 RepID=A0A2A4T6X1_9DELT|nr:MAG: hypothetical protein COB67_05015 [SAR324 cluster bacterium]
MKEYQAPWYRACIRILKILVPTRVVPALSLEPFFTYCNRYMIANNSESLSSEQELFKKKVKQFLLHCKAKEQKLIIEKKRRDFTLETMIANAPKLSSKAVDVFFEKSDEALVSPEIVAEIRSSMHQMRETINSMPNQKRFYILETMNFFSSQISIGKLIPALLMLSGNDQKKLIWEFSKPTFASINTNVEILVSTEEIFSPKSIHLDRGSLYLFVSDVAKVLVRLFDQSFLEQFSESRSPVELMLQIIEFSEKNVEQIYSNILDDPYELQKVILDFVSTIQSHNALYDYSLKRNEYYKLFIDQLTKPERFRGIAPEDVSKILAGCLITNQQCQVEEALLEAMTSDTLYSAPATIQARRQFVDGLAPSVVYRLINRFMSNFQQLSKTNVGKDMSLIQTLSVRNILKTVWKNVIQVIEQGVSAINEGVTLMFNKITKVYATFAKEDARAFPTVGVKNAKGDETVPMDPACIARMSEAFSLVDTDLIAFRGEYDGASKKDYSYNARLFKQDESSMLKFQKVFEQVFNRIQSNSRVKMINYKGQRKIKEYYAAYCFEKYLICFGITHQKNVGSQLIQEKSLFPYVLLFKEGTEKNFGRVLSREVETENGTTIYNEVPLTGPNSGFYYEPLYHFLHLLPERTWNSSEVQTCVKFLVRELHQIKKNSGQLLFCETLPELEED